MQPCLRKAGPLHAGAGQAAAAVIAVGFAAAAPHDLSTANHVRMLRYSEEMERQREDILASLRSQLQRAVQHLRHDEL